MPVSHLTSSRAELLAALLNVLDEGADASALTMTEAELLAAIRNTYGGSVSALTTSYGGLLASIETAAGGSGNALTESRAQMLSGLLTARGGSGSNLTLSEGELLASIANIPAEGGGVPAWVPDNAVIHIDLVGGSPQGRAWVAGTGIVAVDTLLGADANTENAWDTTNYDAGNLTAGGYVGGSNIPAFIGLARTAILAGCTGAIKFKEVGGSASGSRSVALVAADGDHGLGYDLVIGSRSAVGSSWEGSYSDNIPTIVNAGVGAANCVAFTITPTRSDFAANGSDAETAVLDTDDYPTTGAGEIVAVLIDIGTADEALQSITLYDALPSTAGLSELSETGVANTAPHDLDVAWLEIAPDGVVSAAAVNPVDPIANITVVDDEGNPCPIVCTVNPSLPGDNFLIYTPSLASGVLALDAIVVGGPYSVTLRATDPGGLFVEQEFTITVTA